MPLAQYTLTRKTERLDVEQKRLINIPFEGICFNFYQNKNRRLSTKTLRANTKRKKR